jgi:hypothetical protein
MTASYPNTVKVWSPTDANFDYPEDLRTIVFARHVTTLYDEVTAVQRELGAGGLKTGIVDDLTPSSYNSSDAVVYDTLRARLNNMEQGVLTANKRRVSTLGGSSIEASSTTVGLVLKTSGTGNLLEIRNTSDTLVNHFAADGTFFGVIDGGTA